MGVTVTVGELYQVYHWGAMEGQLLMEEERENEEIFDAFICVHSGKKYGVPSAPARRRQIHSEKWFAAMRKAKTEFNEFIMGKITGGENNGKN